MRTNYLLLALLTCISSALLVGCDAKAKKERHLKRAEQMLEKKDLESARLEYLNVLRIQPDNAEAIVNLSTIFFDRGEAGPAFIFLRRAKELQPNNLTVRANLGSLMASAGMYEEARAEAQFLLEQDPAHGEGLLILASASIQTNEVTATRQRLQQMLPAQATNAYLHLALGNLHLKTREVNKAEEAFKKAQSLNPTSSRFRMALGNVYWMQGQTNEANAEFKAATELAPVKSTERLRWADFKIKMGEVEEGKKILQEALKQAPDFIPALNMLAETAFVERKLDEAATWVHKALEHEPNNYAALMNRARLARAQGDVNKAIEDLEVIAKIYPKDPIAQFHLANAHLANNDSAKAIGFLDKAISLHTNYVDAILLKCEVQLNKGDIAGAIPTLLRVSEANPHVQKVQYLLANAYRMRGSPEDALRVYDSMQERFPKDPQPAYFQGMIYRQLKQPDLARKAYERSLQVVPTFVPPIDELLELDILEKNYTGAIQRAEKYISAFPDKPTPRFFLAKVYAAQRKLPEAEAALQKVLELEPDFYPAHQALAHLYLATQKPEEALKKFQQMVDKNPNDLRALFQVAMVHETSGNRNKARDIYEECLKLNPKYAPALNNLAYIIGEEGKDLQRAATLAREARQLVPNDPYIADTYGWISLKSGDYPRALQLIQEAASKIPQAEVLYHLGIAHYMMGQESAARKALEAAVEVGKEAPFAKEAAQKLAVLNVDPRKPDDKVIGMLKNAIEQNPNDLFAQLRFAEIHVYKREPKTAEKAFEAALKANPKAAMVLARFAAFHLEVLNNGPRGLELAREAWGLAPAPVNALELARLGCIGGDAKWAMPLLQEARRVDSENPRLSFYSAWAASSLGKIQAAQEALKPALTSKQPYPEQEEAKAFNVLLEFLNKGGNAQQGTSAATFLLGRRPSFAAALVAQGVLAEGQKNYTAAREVYEKALASDPGSVLAQRYLAVLLSEQLANDNRALELASRARTQAPEDGALSKVIGKVHYRRGDFREAVRFLRESQTRSTTEDADLLYHLGMAQYKLNDRQAKSSLTRALSLDKNGKLAPEAEKALAELK